MARDSQFMPRQARPNEAYLRAQLLFQHAPIDACQTDPGCMIIHDRPAPPHTSSSAPPPHRKRTILPPTGRSAAAVGARRVQPTTPVGSHRDSIAGVASEWPMTVSLSRMVTAGPERGCSGSADRRGSRGYRCSPVAARANGWSARSGLLGAAGFLRASFSALGYGWSLPGTVTRSAKAGLVTGFTAALPGRRAPRPWTGEMAGSRAVVHSNPEVSPAPRRRISGVSREKSMTVVGSVPQSPESITASTAWPSWPAEASCQPTWGLGRTQPAAAGEG